MHRYQSNSKGKSRSNSEALFPLLILLGCFAYSHKVLVLEIEHLVPVILVSTLGLMISVVIARSIFLFRGRMRIRPSKMSDIDRMRGLEFEKYVAHLLNKQGYRDIRLTEEFDYGVDIIATKDNIRWGIQVKRYSGLVKANAVRQVVTALRKYDCDRSIVITNSTYSKVAKELARSNDCVLIDRDILTRWSSGYF